MKGFDYQDAEQFIIKPETIQWANQGTLNNNPELLTFGMNLNILASDGIYYKWKAGGTVADVAERFKVESFAILFFENT